MLSYVLFIVILSFSCSAQMIQCGIQNVLKDETIFPTIDKFGFLIERNNSQNKPLSIDEIHQPLFQKVFMLENNHDIRSIINTESELSMFEMQFCMLIRQSDLEYQILCKDGFKNFQIDNQFSFNYTHTYTLRIQTSIQDNCEHLFQNSEYQFVIICFGNSYFKLLTVTQQNKGNSELLENVDIIQNQQCEKNAIFKNNQIIIFYKACVSWKVYIIKDFRVFKQISQTNFNAIDEPLLNICFPKNPKNLLHLHFCCKEIIYQTEQDTFTTQKIDICSDKKGIFYNLDCKQIIYQNQSDIYLSEKNQRNNIIIIQNVKDLKYIFLIQDLLILQEQDQVIVFMSQNLRQSFNCTLKYFQILKETNYFFGIDQQTNHIVFFKLHVQPQFYNIKDEFSDGKFIFEFSRASIFNLNNELLLCSRLNVITSNKNSLIEIYDQNKLEFQEMLDNNFIFNLKRRLFLVQESVILELVDQSFIIIDTQNYSNVCEINEESLKKSSQSFYIFYNLYKKTIAFQTPDYLKFFDCETRTVTKFKVKVKLNNQMTCTFQNRLVTISQDQKIIYFFQAMFEDIKILKIIKFKNIIEKIFNIDVSILFVQFQNFETQNLDIITYQQIDLQSQWNLPIHEPILYYFRGRLNHLIIQYQNYLAYRFKDQTTLWTFSQMEIILIYSSPYFRLICMNANSQLVEYEFLNGILIYKGQYRLLDYKIIQPLQYFVSSSYLAIAVKKDNYPYVIIFFMNDQLKYQFMLTRRVGNLQFQINQGKLIYYDLKNELKLVDLEFFKLRVSKQFLCQKDQLFNKIKYRATSILSQNKTLEGFLIVATPWSCNSMMQKLVSYPIVLKKGSNKFTLNDYIRGHIEYLQIKSTHPAIKLDGPLVFSESIENCISFQETLCVGKSPQSQILFVFDLIQNKQYKVDLIQQANNNFILISWRIIEQQFTICYTENQTFYIDNYQLQDQTFQRTQIHYYMNAHLPYLKDFLFRTSGNLTVINFYNESLIIKIEKNFISLEIYEPVCDFLKIKGTEDDYIFNYIEIESNIVQLSIEIRKLQNSELFDIKSFKINNTLLNQVLNNYDEIIDYFQISESRLISSVREENQILIKIIIFCTNQYAFLSHLIISDSNQINLKVKKILRCNHSIKDMVPQYYDESFFIQSPFAIYDLRGVDFFIDSFYQIDDNYKVFQYNSSHFIFQNSLKDIYFVQIDYSLQVSQLINKNDDKKDFNLSLEAGNQFEKLEFNINIIFDIPLSNNINSGILLIILILILISIVSIIYFIRRKKLLAQKEQNQNNKRKIKDLFID